MGVTKPSLTVGLLTLRVNAIANRSSAKVRHGPGTKVYTGSYCPTLATPAPRSHFRSVTFRLIGNAPG